MQYNTFNRNTPQQFGGNQYQLISNQNKGFLGAQIQKPQQNQLKFNNIGFQQNNQQHQFQPQQIKKQEPTYQWTQNLQQQSKEMLQINNQNIFSTQTLNERFLQDKILSNKQLQQAQNKANEALENLQNLYTNFEYGCLERKYQAQ